MPPTSARTRGPVSRLSRLGFIDTRRTEDPVRRRVRSRGVPPALEGREVFYTDDPHEAERLLGKAFAPCRLTLGEIGGGHFAAIMNGIRMREVSLLYLDLQVPVTVEIAHSGTYYAVHMPTNGRAIGERAGEPFEANTISAVVVNPGDPLTMRLDQDSPQLIVRFEQDAFERHLTRLLGRMLTHPVGFAATFDLTSERAMRWHGALQMLHTEVLYPGSLVHDGRGIGPLEEFLISSLLMVQRSSYSDLLTGAAPAAGRRTVRQALDFIEAYLSEPITVADIATHVGASVRTIQQGFRDELDSTPMSYLRDRRLERVREDLIDAEPGAGVTVTTVAAHWGFTHLGSFAGLYRKRWGESPSQTLRR